MNEIIQGDCLQVMREMKAESIDMCLTSPPYWGLRDYGHDDQLGLEKTPEEYIERMTAVFSEVKRVLKAEGTLWLNMGDTYSATRWSNTPSSTGISKKHCDVVLQKKHNLPDKCLCMIPERLAWSLIQDGWILRNKIIWYKPNGMPSSVKDRFSNKWEYIFLFSKSRKYYFDLDAVREAHTCIENRPHGVVQNREWGYDSKENLLRGRKWEDVPGQQKQTIEKHSGYYDKDGNCLVDFEKGKNPGDVFTVPSETRTLGAITGVKGAVKVPGGKGWTGHPPGGENALRKDPRWSPPEGKNPGDFWSINTQPFPQAHFAVFPEKLCEKPIRAGCPEGGTVLDPFCGAGTTCYVAKEMNRNYIGIEINPEYIKIAEKRLTQEVLFSQVM